MMCAILYLPISLFNLFRNLLVVKYLNEKKERIHILPYSLKSDILEYDRKQIRYAFGLFDIVAELFILTFYIIQ